ncbi:hypothetical protein KY290_008169 [Solanum tuberosum]|uniref:BTB domain-containing protein n=1 Tax=Solanum tuberosum TaxID=4113 RepID=A0ABQ7W9H0_SOLTU|nr:hypothetical protein KY290_008169 [Solanum tuberosum]
MIRRVITPSQQADGSFEVRAVAIFSDELQSRSNLNASSSASQAKSSTSNSEHTSNEVQKPSIGSRATDSSRLMKFPKELSATTFNTVLRAYYLGSYGCHDPRRMT